MVRRRSATTEAEEMAIAHIGHAELRVTDLEASREFFTEVLGLFVSDETDSQVYLRAWQDWDHHTLLLTQSDESGLGHVAWRVSGPDDLAEHAKQLQVLGVELDWVEGGNELGHGDSIRFLTPVSGIPAELYWEVERYAESSSELRSSLPSHPQRFTGKGIAPRRFDHVNFLVDDVRAEQEWHSEQLGIRHNYYVVGADETRLGSWLARTNVSHEIAFMRNKAQDGNKLHHVAYYLDSPDQLVRAATLIADAGVQLEWGPGAHGTSGAIFLYCFEPSGNRVEVWTGGFLLFPPDWEPIRWDPETASLGLELWGSAMPDTYLTYGTSLASRVPTGQPAA
jgi:catechol 2,3-dioxygenase